MLGGVDGGECGRVADFGEGAELGRDQVAGRGGSGVLGQVDT